MKFLSAVNFDKIEHFLCQPVPNIKFMKKSKNKRDELILSKISELEAKREKILSVTSQDALALIIDDKEALPLVHSFSEQDLHLLIHEIGIEDALPILAMASSKQLIYILDTEVWDKDRFDFDEALHWLILFRLSDPASFIDRLIKLDDEEEAGLIDFILNRFICMGIRGEDDDPSSFEDGFFTFDDTFYMKTKFTEENRNEDAEDFIRFFLRDIASYDYSLFQRLLFSSSAVIPSELEEELFRLRNVRLAEKGFAPYYEAVGIYQPLTYEILKKSGKKCFSKKIRNESSYIPALFFEREEEKNLFTSALGLINDPIVMNGLSHEFASLCNNLISADKMIIKSRKDLVRAVEKVSGYLNIGLESFYRRSENVAESEEKFAAGILRHCMVADIFRFGYEPLSKLKKRAKRFVEESFFKTRGFSLNLLDEKFTGVCGGLLLKTPLFFDNYKNGTLYREFASVDDIKNTEKELDKAIAADRLLKTLDIITDEIREESSVNFISYKNLLLTFLVKKRRILSFVTKEELIEFFNLIFERYDYKKDRQANRIKPFVKKEFLLRLFSEASDTLDTPKESLSEVLEELFAELEEEYRYIDDFRFLDSRYIRLFLMTEP